MPRPAPWRFALLLLSVTHEENVMLNQKSLAWTLFLIATQLIRPAAANEAAPGELLSGSLLLRMGEGYAAATLLDTASAANSQPATCPRHIPPPIATMLRAIWISFPVNVCWVVGCWSTNTPAWRRAR